MDVNRIDKIKDIFETIGRISIGETETCLKL